VLPALVRCCAPRFWAGCLAFGASVFLIFDEGDFAGRSIGLSGSMAGDSARVYGLGVDPVGFGVHLVPLPVMKRDGP